jgi:mono/diheme cytochrome c family protein
MPETDEKLLSQAEGIITAKACRGCHRPDDSVDENDGADLAPPLNRIAERRPGTWIRRFLRYPETIRPNQLDRMPQLNLTDYEVEVIARYLEHRATGQIESLPEVGPKRDAKPWYPKLITGRRLFVKYNCMNCHSLGKHQIRIQRDEDGKVVFQPSAERAPDLTHAWKRLRPAWLQAMLSHPPTWMPWSRMPELDIEAEDVEDLGWFIMNTTKIPTTEIKAADVEKLLKDKCSSCHGGGESARGLDLSTLQGLRKGGVDKIGLPLPVMIPYAENSPILKYKHEKAYLSVEEREMLREWVLAGAE